jgi:site-specific DNA-methyltransferase (adenine-specific)
MLELNKIYNMDCLEGMKYIEDESIDLIVTDPPYLMNYKTNYRKIKNHKFCKTILNDNNPNLISKYIKECHRILKNNSAMYIFCNQNKIDFFKQELEKYFKIKNLIVWIKNNWTAGDLKAAYGKQYEFIFYVNKGRREINGKRLTDVWYFKRVAGKQQLHQNQKPLDLIKQCILKSSNEGDLVFDGFMGSGTTAIACKELNRNFIGFELDKEYFDIANKKLENII